MPSRGGQSVKIVNGWVCIPSFVGKSRAPSIRSCEATQQRVEHIFFFPVCTLFASLSCSVYRVRSPVSVTSRSVGGCGMIDGTLVEVILNQHGWWCLFIKSIYRGFLENGSSKIPRGLSRLSKVSHHKKGLSRD